MNICIKHTVNVEMNELKNVNMKKTHAEGQMKSHEEKYWEAV